jgi:hypothetical protein
MTNRSEWWQRLWRAQWERRNLYVVWLATLLAVSLPLIFALVQTIALAYGILAILNFLAYSMHKDHELRQRLESRLDTLGQEMSSVTIFSSWNDAGVRALISSATTSIVIVDTWYDEATELANLITKAMPHVNGQLRVDVYMLSESLPFGGQRKKEIADTGSSGAAYAQSFGEAVAALNGNVGKLPNVKLSLYKYDTMPGVRLIVIDDQKFVFSWFPLGAYSVNNVCVFVSTDSVSKGDIDAIKCLRRQLERIHAATTKIVTGAADPVSP